MRHTARLTASEADVLRSVVGATLSGLVVEFPVVYLMIGGRPIAIVPEAEGIVDSTHPIDEVMRIGVATEQDRRGWYKVRAKGRGSRIVPDLIDPGVIETIGVATAWIGASEVVVAPPTVVLGVSFPPGLAYGLEFFNPDDLTDAEVNRMGRVGPMAEVDLGIVAHLATGQEIWMCTDGVRLAASVSIGEPEVTWHGCGRITWLERLVGS